MPRVRLIHWNPEEAAEKAALLRSAGYEVEAGPLDQAGIRLLRADPPAALVIDLSRLPAQGRDLGLHLRRTESLARVPLVFVDGPAEKVDRVRQLLPDARFTTWRRIRGTLRRALAKPPARPVIPDSVFAAYAGTPLPKKLGIRENAVVALIGAPEEFPAALGRLPAGVTLRRRLQGRTDLILCFVRSRRELERRLGRVGGRIGRDGLWIAWPKKSSGVASDLNQAVVRRAGLDAGLVDYKICAVDRTWSALRFTRRR